MNLPVVSLPEITPAWLTGLLQSKGHDVVVDTVIPARIGTGQVGATYRLHLAFQGDCATCPSTLVAKLPSDDELSRVTGKSHLTYLRESRFYQNFAGRKPMAIPDHLYVAFDDDNHDFTLIMQDLPKHAAGDQLAVPSRAEAMLAMEAAASIHAAWWGDPMLDTLDWLNGTAALPPPVDVDALYDMFWPAFCDRYTARITAEMKRVGDAFVGRVGAWVAAKTGPRCLTHNDFRPDNMLFAPDDGVQPIVVVDWQTVGVGQGASDIAYYMGTAFDPVTRRTHEGVLLDSYRAALAAKGMPDRDLADLWNSYRSASFAGFLMGATAAMVVTQTDRGDAMFLAMCDRSAHMVLDHADLALPG